MPYLLPPYSVNSVHSVAIFSCTSCKNLLPTHDNSREPFSREDYRHVWQELTEKFGGIMVYTRAPAEGHWKLNDNHTSRDDIVIVEVMASELDKSWCAITGTNWKRVSGRT